MRRSALTSFTGGPSNSPSQLAARNGGAVLAPLLATLDYVSLALDGSGSLPVGQITGLTNGALSVSGGAYAFAALTDLSNSTLGVSAGSVEMPLATDLRGSTVTVSGGSLALPAAADIDGASFVVSGGVSLALPAATTYTNFGTSTTRTFQAGPGGVLDLSALTSITNGPDKLNVLNIQALGGGHIDLSRTAVIQGGLIYGDQGVDVTADGAVSSIDLSSLTSYTGSPGRVFSDVIYRNGRGRGERPVRRAGRRRRAVHRRLRPDGRDARRELSPLTPTPLRGRDWQSVLRGGEGPAGPRRVAG
jgi:hypothetical protein